MISLQLEIQKMKSRDDLAWVMAMDELQGNIPDPSSFRSADHCNNNGKRTIPYTFRVIRYVHDPSVGEMLNIGVLLYAPDAAYLGFKFVSEPLSSRLSNTFVNFDGENFRRYISRMEFALQRVGESVQPGLGLCEPPRTLDAITRLVFLDTEGSFQPGPVLAGITDDPAAELEIIFERMVTSQYKREFNRSHA